MNIVFLTELEHAALEINLPGGFFHRDLVAVTFGGERHRSAYYPAFVFEPGGNIDQYETYDRVHLDGKALGRTGFQLGFEFAFLHQRSVCIYFGLEFPVVTWEQVHAEKRVVYGMDKV